MTTQDLVQLSLLLDGELTPVESAALRLRLQEEPELRRAYERLQRLGSVVLLPTAVDAKASAEAMGELGFGTLPSSPRWPWIVGSLVVALLVGGLFFAPTGEVEPPNTTPPALPTVPSIPPRAVARPPAAAPPEVSLQPDSGTVVLEVPSEGEWVRVRGTGTIELSGAKLAVQGEALLAVDRGGTGRIDAPLRTRGTEFFGTPDGATIVAFVLDGSITSTPAPGPPDPERRASAERLLVGERRVFKVQKDSVSRVLDAMVLVARTLDDEHLEVRGLKEGETTLEFMSRSRRISMVIQVSSRDRHGVPTRHLEVGDVQEHDFPGLLRFSPGDQTIARVKARGSRLTFTGLRPGRTTLQLWFEDGHREDWAVVVPGAPTVLVGQGRFAFVRIDERALLADVPVGSRVTVEPASLARTVPLEATTMAVLPLAVGSGKVVVTETSGTRHEISLTVRSSF
jgi:hypothetical protein